MAVERLSSSPPISMLRAARDRREAVETRVHAAELMLTATARFDRRH
jgi:hypothetical protein